MSKGRIVCISIGNSPRHLTFEAVSWLRKVDVIAGHEGFIDMVSSYLRPSVETISNRRTRQHATDFAEAQQYRVAACVSEALRGKTVGILSGGDTGIWGEAAFFIEAQRVLRTAFDIEIVPGVSSLVSCAAAVGAPLMNGCVLLAIGDEDTPFDVVRHRVDAVGDSGLPIVLFKVVLESVTNPEFYPAAKYPDLYPPIEKTRTRLAEIYSILEKYIPADRAMAVITNVADQTRGYLNDRQMLLTTDDNLANVRITSFCHFLDLWDEYRFFTTIIIGGDETRTYNGLLYTAQWAYTWEFSEGLVDQVRCFDYLTSIVREN